MNKAPLKVRMATTSLAGCFGCHMSLLDIDERLFELAGKVEFDRSPLTDIKHCGPCDIALIEGGVCNSENVHVLRELRANAKILVAVGACAINGGLPALRNHLDIGDILKQVYGETYPERPRTAAAARQGLSHQRDRARRLFPARLPAERRRDLEISDRPHLGPHPEAGAAAVSL